MHTSLDLPKQYDDVPKTYRGDSRTRANVCDLQVQHTNSTFQPVIFPYTSASLLQPHLRTHNLTHLPLIVLIPVITSIPIPSRTSMSLTSRWPQTRISSLPFLSTTLHLQLPQSGYLTTTSLHPITRSTSPARVVLVVYSPTLAIVFAWRWEQLRILATVGVATRTGRVRSLGSSSELGAWSSDGWETGYACMAFAIEVLECCGG